MKTRRIGALFSTVAIVALSACAGGYSGDLGSGSTGLNKGVDVRIAEVGYGGTGELGGQKIIFPEYFVLLNHGDKTANVGGWYLSDGAAWGGDGVARLPQGSTIPAGGSLVVANYPPVTSFEAYWGYRQVSFETVHGYAPDVEIGGWDQQVPDAETIRGRIRLKHGECSYDAECWTVEEQVWLLDGAGLDDAAVVSLLESGSFADHVASTYPQQ